MWERTSTAPPRRPTPQWDRLTRTDLGPAMTAPASVRPDRHAIEFGGRQFGVDRPCVRPTTATTTASGEVLELPHQAPGVAIGGDRGPLNDIAARDPHPCLVHRRVVETVLAHGGRRGRALHSRPVRTPHSNATIRRGWRRTVGRDAGNRPGEVADQGAKRRVEWREGSGAEGVEVPWVVRRPERPSGDRSLWPRGC